MGMENTDTCPSVKVRPGSMGPAKCSRTGRHDGAGRGRPFPAPPRRIRITAFSRLAKVATGVTSGTLALLLIVHARYRRVGATPVEDRIAGWSDDIRERGGRVEIEVLAIGGSPLRFDVRAASVLVEAAGPRPVRSWRGGVARPSPRRRHPQEIHGRPPA